MLDALRLVGVLIAMRGGGEGWEWEGGRHLGCTFRRIPVGFRRKLAESHRQEKCESLKHRNAL
jgi:hypothetical protein